MVLMELGREMYIPFGLHCFELSTRKCRVILSLALQFVAIRHAPYSQYTVLYNRSHQEPNTCTLHSVYLSCAANTNCICTVECHLQFNTNKEKTDTKSSSATAQFQYSVPVILGENQTLCKYKHNNKLAK